MNIGGWKRLKNYKRTWLFKSEVSPNQTNAFISFKLVDISVLPIQGKLKKNPLS